MSRRADRLEAPSAARAPGRPVLAVLIGAALLATLVAETLLLRFQFDPGIGGDPELRVLLDASVAIALFGSGVVAWAARPASRVGPLMYLTGWLYLIKNLSWSGVPAIVYPAIGFASLWTVTLAVVVLAYPTGRLVRRDERLLAWAAFGWVGLSSALSVALRDTRDCAECWQNPWVLDLPLTEADLESIGMVVGAVLWVAYGWLILRRWHRASAVARRWLAPVWLSGVIVGVVQLGGILVPAVADPGVAFVVSWLIADPVTIVIPISLTWGLVRGRLAQATVGDLVVELGGDASAEGVRSAVARVLGDPAVSIAVDSPVSPTGLVDLDGRLVDPGGRALTPIADDLGTVAYLVHDPSLEANPGLVRAVAAATRLALDNQRLAREVEANLEEVRASRKRLLDASDAERARMERDLHDGAQQRLVTLGLRLRTRSELAADVDERITYAALADELDGALAELRDLARGLHPTAVTQAGLAGAVEGLADRCQVPIEVDIPDHRYPQAVEVAAWFVIAEAVTNAVKHARATRITVQARPTADVLTLTVSDDGVGGAVPSEGSGLTGLADRLAALGGRLGITSARGQGTIVTADLPLVTP